MLNLDVLYMFPIKKIGVNIMIKCSLPLKKWIKSLRGENCHVVVNGQCDDSEIVCSSHTRQGSSIRFV